MGLSYSLTRRERFEANVAAWNGRVLRLSIYLSVSAALLLALRPSTPLGVTLALLPAWQCRDFFRDFAKLLWPSRLDMELDLAPGLLKVREGSGESFVLLGGTDRIVRACRFGGTWAICSKFGDPIPVPDRLLSEEQRTLLASKGG